MASSSLNHKCKYDVFLSFRGEDTRNSFTDHLYAALRGGGIRTFRDDQLRKGKQISPALLDAIENSRFCIIIFSENYASSSWCLDELVKIIDCRKAMGHEALPVFYKVDPSVVRKQTGTFAEAFAKHEQVYKDNTERVIEWRRALTEAANLSGWHSPDRHESEVIKEIVNHILDKVTDTFPSHMEGLVGMDSHLEAMDSRLCIGLNDVKIVGIWGMAGIGKTTIAEAVYRRIFTQFEGYCFLSSVRELSERCDGLNCLQEHLVSQILGQRTSNKGIFSRGINIIKDRLQWMKVLIILDDVDCEEHMIKLAGNRTWFGGGSRIIITSRDNHFLSEKYVDATYQVPKLGYNESVKLFSGYAFKHDCTKDYLQLCRRAVDYAGGIPLALRVLGCFLYDKSIVEWKSELDKIGRNPPKAVQDVLKISYERLEDNEKDIFLDIACFFKGQDKEFVTEILESCGFFPEIGIRVLINKSLITLLDNKLCMHDLVQKMGWEIVEQESRTRPGERSRLFNHNDVNHVLTRNKGSEAVQGMVVSTSKELNFCVDAFVKMSNLRLLRVDGFKLYGISEYLCDEKELQNDTHAWMRRYDKKCRLNLCGDFRFLSNDLRSLYWPGYPLKSLPSNFHPEKLVELNMRDSRLEQLWNGNKSFQKLKFMKLSHSKHLTTTPNFYGTPELGRLILEGCTSLVEVHPSIGGLKKLIFMNLKDCNKLRVLPSSIHMESLQILILSGCCKLDKFPEFQRNMGHLSELYLEGTAIEGLHSSIEYLTGLVLLNMRNCKNLKSLPSGILSLKSLKTLILSNCSRLETLPETLEKVESLMELFIDGTGLKEVPSSIGNQTGLVLLKLSDCRKLTSLGEGICELTSLRTLTLSGCSELRILPSDLERLQCLVELNADGTAIQEVPPSISRLRNLQVLSFRGCKVVGQSIDLDSILSFHPIGLQLPSFSGLHSLKKLLLSDCNILEGALPRDLGSLACLEWLDLSGNNFHTIPCNLGGFARLKRLLLGRCKSLQSLPELPSSIQELDAHDCTSLESFSTPSAAYTLKTGKDLGRIKFKFSNCFQLRENEHRDVVEALIEGIQLLASTPAFLHDCYCPRRTLYEAAIPGNRIPEWFIHRSQGSSIIIDLPGHWNKLMGFAFCAVVGSSRELASCDIDMSADHIWFGYNRIEECHNRCPFMVRKGNSLWVTFGSMGVKKCGVRLVYNKNMNQNKTFWLVKMNQKKTAWLEKMNQETKMIYRKSAARFAGEDKSGDDLSEDRLFGEDESGDYPPEDRLTGESALEDYLKDIHRLAADNILARENITVDDISEMVRHITAENTRKNILDDSMLSGMLLRNMLHRKPDASNPSFLQDFRGDSSGRS